MQRDIRDLFKEDERLKTLPESHRTEFLGKLKTSKEKKRNPFIWLKIAAVLVIGLMIGYAVINRDSEKNVSPMIAQIEAVEAEYLRDIQEEWQNFVAITDDKVLVERFKKRLDELDKDYQEISQQFKNDSNNIEVVETLVENLQTRLQILKDIQEHIKILNQKSEHHENTI